MKNLVCSIPPPPLFMSVTPIVSHLYCVRSLATMSHNRSYSDRRRALAQVAKETITTGPVIMANLPHLNAAASECLALETLPPLDPAACPQFTLPVNPHPAPSSPALGTPVRVFNQDSFDAAIAMRKQFARAPAGIDAPSVTAKLLDQLTQSAQKPDNLVARGATRVAVLNMASDKNPGGGWLGGASAQEEALCYRSTLAASLHKGYYPISPRSGLYTPDVVVFRQGMGAGHGLMAIPATELPVTSVLSVAGLRRPDVRPGDGGRLVFAAKGARDLTKDKMRLCLRMAASRGHVLLVLGAIGCGAFRNPPQEIADCWMEVLSENEFAGGWFKEIWFAVFDTRGEVNCKIFSEVFHDKVVGKVDVQPS